MPDRPGVEDLSRCQHGVVSRSQLIALGLTPAQAWSRVRSGRWRSLGGGVYVTHTGSLTLPGVLWAELLRAGPGAVAGPRSTLWLAGLTEAPATFDIEVPAERRVRKEGSLRVRRRRGLDAVRQPAGRPPRLRIEEAVLDVADAQRHPRGVVDVVLRAVQRRVTTPARLGAALERRRAHRWRALLLELLADAGRGVSSPLEWRWVQNVERAHGLPVGVVNRPDRDPDGRRRFRDVEYVPWLLVCELDGREAHPDDERFRDRHRDNHVAVSGRVTLRYGWREVADDPCGVAAQVASVLAAQGWPGTLHPCGATCRALADGETGR